MDKNTVNQHFINAVNFLISSKIVGSKSALAEKLQITASKFSEILKERMNVGADTLSLISTEFGISTNYLLKGEGNILDSNKVIDPNTDKIPLLTIEAFAGNGDSSVFGEDLTRVTDRYEIPLFDGLHVDFMVNVKGSSMYPKYNSGDVVACKIINEILFIQWNKVYVIDSASQGVLLKRLKPSSNDQTVICKSDNKDYDEFELPKSDIRKLAMVVGVVRLE